MNASAQKAGFPAGKGVSELGRLLRYWRSARSKSQLDVSLDTGISQRHISFIESGRSLPSRQALIDIAQVLDVPLRERNTLFQAAGYAPMYSESPVDALEMQGVRKALERMLHQHAPFPAIVMDRGWNVFMANEYASRFFNCFIDMAARKGPRNMLHLIFDPDGMRPFVANWEDVAKSLIQRVYRESVGHVVDENTRHLLAALLAYPDVRAEWKSPAASSVMAPAMPVIPLGFIKDGMILNYFSMVTTVGAPQAVTTQELRIECLFPSDEVTEAYHIEMMARAEARPDSARAYPG